MRFHEWIDIEWERTFARATLKPLDPARLTGPQYSLYRYTDQIYKVVRFASPRLLVTPVASQADSSAQDVLVVSKTKPSDGHSSRSRAKRIILELALCNPWDYFCTFTLDPAKYDRHDLPKFHKDLTQFMRDQRKKYGCECKFLLVPETHKDGAWHIHGLVRDCPSLVKFADLRSQGWQVPDRLISGDYSCWLDAHKKFGFVSCGRIHNPTATAFYVTKYVSKDIDDCVQEPGKHRYYASRPLARAEKHGDIYLPHVAELDRYLTNFYEFCASGFTQLSDSLDEDFALDYMNPPKLCDLTAPECFPDDDIDRVMFESAFDFIQTQMEGYYEKDDIGAFDPVPRSDSGRSGRGC